MKIYELSTTRKFVEHKIATEKPEPISAIKYEYLLAGNGLFIRAKRRELSVSLPISSQKIKELPEAEFKIKWHLPRISKEIWREILKNARMRNDFTEFKEDVYAIYWNVSADDWLWENITKDRQFAAAIADDKRKEYREACIELHTHPTGANHFSEADDLDETGKFRIFGILIDIHSITPKIRFRCGVYDYFIQIPSNFVSEMPSDLIDLNDPQNHLKQPAP